MEKELSRPVSIVVGGSPGLEVQLIPSWIVFSAEDQYRTGQYATFKVRNNESVPVVYRVRTKHRSFPRFSICHGFLRPNEEDEIIVVIPAAENWPRDPAEFAGRRHKVMIENLTVPIETMKPQSRKEAARYSASIFRATQPLTRMYTKLNIILPKMMEFKTDK